MIAKKEIEFILNSATYDIYEEEYDISDDKYNNRLTDIFNFLDNFKFQGKKVKITIEVV